MFGQYCFPWIGHIGEVVEWSITAVLKTVELKGSGGSNPSLSATRAACRASGGLYLFPHRKRAYTGDVSTPIGIAVRSGGAERAYMGDVSTPILIINCEKNVFSILI